MPEARSPYLVALLNPFHLAMLALTAAAGLCAAWWLFPIGLLFWAIMIVVAANDPQLRLKATIENRDRTPLAQRFQPYMDKVENSQTAIYRNLAAAAEKNQRALAPLRSAVDALVDVAYQMCVRMTALENHRLVQQSNADTQKDLVKINELTTNASDPAAKAQYETSRQALEKRQTELQALVNLLDRFEAQLNTLKQEMDSTLTDTIQMQALDPNQVSAQAPKLVQGVRAQLDALRSFEKEVAEQRLA